jgi:putative transposase
VRSGRPKALLTISSDERAQLVAITRSRSLPAALALRANIVLACKRELSNAVVATWLDVNPHTIGKWRNRFIADGIKGLYDEMRTGRPRTVDDMAVAELITKTLARKPMGTFSPSRCQIHSTRLSFDCPARLAQQRGDLAMR